MTPIETIPPRSKRWGSLGAGVDVLLCRGASLRPLTVVTAGIHGDEYEGPAAVAELARKLDPEIMTGSVAAVPVANPMAFCAAQRVSPGDDQNLARTFPGKSDGTSTEQLAALLFEGLARGADYLIDLHSGGLEYLFSPLAGFYGPATDGNPSFRAAHHFGLPVLWQLPETAGVLSREAWRIGVASIGAEYLGAGQISPDGVAAYTAGVLSCLALWGILPATYLLPAGGHVFAGDWRLAGATGLFFRCCDLGDAVVAGDALAEIRTPAGAVLETLTAPSTGSVLAIRSKAYI